VAKITKKKRAPDDLLAVKLISGLAGMSLKDQVKTIQAEYEMAKSMVLDYEKLKAELDDYTLQLPEDPDVTDFSEAKNKYHLAQSYFSRASNIEANALANEDRWRSVRSHVEEYIMDRESRLLTDDKLLEKYPNSNAQKAAVRAKLKKSFRMLSVVKNEESRAKAFSKMVEIKKKDLDKFITNLSRQMRIVSMEMQQTR
jgi:hypothetical protein